MDKQHKFIDLVIELSDKDFDDRPGVLEPVNMIQKLAELAANLAFVFLLLINLLILCFKTLRIRFEDLLDNNEDFEDHLKDCSLPLRIPIVEVAHNWSEKFLSREFYTFYLDITEGSNRF